MLVCTYVRQSHSLLHLPCTASDLCRKTISCMQKWLRQSASVARGLALNGQRTERRNFAASRMRKILPRLVQGTMAMHNMKLLCKGLNKLCPHFLDDFPLPDGFGGSQVVYLFVLHNDFGESACQIFKHRKPAAANKHDCLFQCHQLVNFKRVF